MEQCSHCHTFKKTTLNPLRMAINDCKHNIHSILLHLPHAMAELPSSYPKELKNYIGWFPTILLFTPDSWSIHTKQLEGVVFNGVYNGNKWELQPTKQLTPESVISWIDESLSKTPFRKLKLDASKIQLINPKPGKRKITIIPRR